MILEDKVKLLREVGFIDETFKKDVQCFADIEKKTVHWLWFPYIPKGKITILQGDPGNGKTYITTNFASIVSNGGKFPFTDVNVDIGKVILQNGEDGKNDTLKPRLEKAGANCKNIFIINEDEELFSLVQLDRLEASLKEYCPSMMIIDPIQRYIGEIDMNSANQVRMALAPIGNLAEKYNVAIILVMHMNKGQVKALYKTLGSIDMVGIARSMLTVGKTIDTNERVLCQTKNNLGPFGKSIIFEINDNGIEWIEERDNVTSEDIVIPIGKKPKEKAKEYLIDRLSNGPVPSIELQKEANELGISPATLNRAKKELDVNSYQNDKKWLVEMKNT